MSKPRKIKLTIPKPCQEDWNKMTPKEQGRFCGQCSKAVVDFSGMSDRELIEYLSKIKGNTCGRLNTTQLDRIIVSPAQSNPNMFRAVLLGTAIVAGATGAARAQNNPPTPPQNVQYLTGTINMGLNNKENEGDYYTGKVIDSQTQKGLANVNVSLEFNGNQVKDTTTDTSGVFRLPGHKEYAGNKLTVILSAFGYKNQEEKITVRKNKLALFKMAEEQEHFIMGDIEITPPEKIKKDSLNKTN